MSESAKDSILTMKEKRKLMKQPVPMLPDAPENIQLSKKEFIAKRQKEKEESLAVEQFRKEYREKKAKDEKEAKKPNAVQEKKETEEVDEIAPKPKIAVRRGRPKKIEN